MRPQKTALTVRLILNDIVNLNRGWKPLRRSYAARWRMWNLIDHLIWFTRRTFVRACWFMQINHSCQTTDSVRGQAFSVEQTNEPKSLVGECLSSWNFNSRRGVARSHTQETRWFSFAIQRLTKPVRWNLSDTSEMETKIHSNVCEKESFKEFKTICRRTVGDEYFNCKLNFHLT